MRYFLPVICFFLAIVSYSQSQSDFYDHVNMTKISAHYNGAAYNGAAIIVYGEAGVILRSVDGGKTWKKIQLNDSLNIIGVERAGSKFIGLCEHGYGITSEDNGKTWVIHDLGQNSKFFQFKKEGDRFFVLIKGKIREINSDFHTISEFEFADNSVYPNFSVSGDFAVCSSDTGQITFIDLKDGNSKTIFLKNAGLSISSKSHIKNLTYINKDSAAYFTLLNAVYKYDQRTDTASMVIFMRNSSSYALTKTNDFVYSIYSNTLQTIYNDEIVETRLDSIYFHKINHSSSKTERISLPKIDRHVYNLKFTNISFLTNDTIIALGKDNLIFMSYDGGVHWELKSNLGDYYGAQLINENEFKAFGAGGRFFYSNSGGNIWLPTKDYHLSVASNLLFDVPDLGGGSYFFRDKNNGYIAVEAMSTNKDTNIIYTNDGGETSHIRIKSDFFREGFKSFPLNYRGRNLLISSGSFVHGWWTMVFDITDSITSNRQDNFTHHQLFHAFADGDNIYALGKDSAVAENVYAIYVSLDTGKTWQEYFTFETENGFETVMPEIKINYGDNIFASWFKTEYTPQDTALTQYLYRIDIKNKEAIPILTKVADGLNSLFKINDNYYISDYSFEDSGIRSGIQFTEDISASPVVWKDVRANRYGSPIFKNKLGDTLFAITAYDSLMRSSSLYLAKVKGSIGVTEPQNVSKLSEITITGPFATLVEGEYTFNVVCGGSLKVENAQYAAYDSRGGRIVSDFRFTPFSEYSGELSWRPGKLAPGAYVITIKAGEAIGATTIIAE